MSKREVVLRYKAEYDKYVIFIKALKTSFLHCIFNTLSVKTLKNTNKRRLHNRKQKENKLTHGRQSFNKTA